MDWATQYDPRIVQQRLNATTPTAGHHGYAPPLPFQQNALGVLAGDDDSEEESITASVATQVTALMHQSQQTSSTMANTSQHHNHQMVHIATQQDLMHQNMHQNIAQLNAVLFNVSNEGHGIGQFWRLWMWTWAFL